MKSFYILFLLFISSCSIYAQQPKKLFRSDSILEVRISFPVKDVISKRSDETEYDATFSFTDNEGDTINHSIKVSLRGKTRARKPICSFPPLQLRFDKKETKNSIFKGQKKLKLVTHCQNDRSFADYIHKEYLVYKMYQLISPYSFNVRLCRITYIDVEKPKKEKAYYGFLIEKIKDVGKRNDMTVFKGKIRNQETLNKDNLDKLVMFQYLIGNLDWSITERHNMKLLIGEGGDLPVAVPYDFDYAGMVNTPYALPPEQFDLPDVKTRLFRGFCRADNYKKTILFYKSIEQDLYNVVNESSYMSEKGSDSMKKYIRSFYTILSADNYTNKKIARACKVNHQHAYE